MIADGIWTQVRQNINYKAAALSANNAMSKIELTSKEGLTSEIIGNFLFCIKLYYYFDILEYNSYLVLKFW